jgi:hypothetical protein
MSRLRCGFSPTIFRRFRLVELPRCRHLFAQRLQVFTHRRFGIYGKWNYLTSKRPQSSHHLLMALDVGWLRLPQHPTLIKRDLAMLFEITMVVDVEMPKAGETRILPVHAGLHTMGESMKLPWR